MFTGRLLSFPEAAVVSLACFPDGGGFAGSLLALLDGLVSGTSMSRDCGPSDKLAFTCARFSSFSLAWSLACRLLRRCGCSIDVSWNQSQEQETC